jgi:hypothetical protein
MKYVLTMDESYRIFIVENDPTWGIEVEVPEDLIQRFKAAEKTFREIEDELYALYMAAKTERQSIGCQQNQ